MSYKRGEVYTIYFPKPKYESTIHHHVQYMPKPHTVIYGKHDAILLTDPDPTGRLLSPDHVHVVAISSARAAVQQGRLLATHVPLLKDQHDFLQHDSFALAFQIITIPAHWIQRQNFRGNIDSTTMNAITGAILLSTGSWKYVQEIIEKMVDQKREIFIEPYDRQA